MSAGGNLYSNFLQAAFSTAAASAGMAKSPTKSEEESQGHQAAPAANGLNKSQLEYWHGVGAGQGQGHQMLNAATAQALR